MVLPLVALLVVALVNVAAAGMALVDAQGLAGRVARDAAVRSDDAVLADLAGPDGRDAGGAVGGPGMRIDIDPPSPRRRPGDLVVVEVHRLLRLPGMLGVEVPIAARATARTEVGG